MQKKRRYGITIITCRPGALRRETSDAGFKPMSRKVAEEKMEELVAKGVPGPGWTIGYRIYEIGAQPKPRVVEKLAELSIRYVDKR